MLHDYDLKFVLCIDKWTKWILEITYLNYGCYELLCRGMIGPSLGLW